jgi:hypothetical protein
MKDIFAGIEEIPEKVGDASEKLDKRLADIAKQRQAREAAMVKKDVQKVEEKAEAVEDAAKVEAEAAKKVDLAKVDPKKAIEEEIKLAKEKMRIHGEMAKKTIADILAESKARKDAAKEWDKDVKRAQELRGRVGRGTKLSKKDAEWLDAFEQIEAARKGLGAAKGQIENAQKQLDAIKDQNKELGNIKDELIKMNRDLNNLLQRG